MLGVTTCAGDLVVRDWVGSSADLTLRVGVDSSAVSDIGRGDGEVGRGFVVLVTGSLVGLVVSETNTLRKVDLDVARVEIG